MIPTKKPLHPLGENTKDNQGIKALQKVNKTVLKATLNHCKNITLDIDASEVIPFSKIN